MINLKSVKGSRTTDLEVYFMKHENMGNTMSGVKSRTLKWTRRDSNYVKSICAQKRNRMKL